MTERLYYRDSELLEFAARIETFRSVGERSAAVLDRTAFYPTGGGQPHDTGTLGRARVIEVVTADDGAVLHVLEGAPELAGRPGDPVDGRVDAPRRRDHTQQHTGQHILSQAFSRVADLETRSFHLGSQRCSIDLGGVPADDDLRAAEALANEIVLSNRPVLIHQVRGDDVQRFPIRRQTFSGDEVRIIEVEDFDWSTCGGTHAPRTGGVGLIAVLGTEKVRGLARVEFACGGRVLGELQRFRAVAEGSARELTTAVEDVRERVRQLVAENRETARRLKRMSGQLAEAEAAALLGRAGQQGEHRWVVEVFADRSLEEVRSLAHGLAAAHPGAVALFGLTEGAKARLVFARGAAVEVSMGELMRSALATRGGRGGGSPAVAQGGLERAADLEAVLAEAQRLLAAAESDRSA